MKQSNICGVLSNPLKNTFDNWAPEKMNVMKNLKAKTIGNFNALIGTSSVIGKVLHSLVRLP